jgi:cellulose synthase (UDP-forming)
MAAGAWRLLTEPVFNDLLVAVMAWNGVNLVIAGAALGAVSERRVLRHFQRIDVRRHGILISGNAEVPVIIEDVSTGGARVRTIDGALTLQRDGETLGTLVVDQVRSEISVRSLSAVIRRADAQTSGDLYGLQFIQVTPMQMMLVADLMYGDFMVLDELRRARRQSKGIFGGSLQFLAWSLRYSLGSFGFALRAGKRPAPAPIKPRRPRRDVGQAQSAQPSLPFGTPPDPAGDPPSSRGTAA